MAKVKHLLSVIFVLTLCCTAQGQAFTIHYKAVDADSNALQQNLSLQSSFPSRMEADAYIYALPVHLQSKGYVTASVDSLYYDSTAAYITLFLGQQYQWAAIKTPASAASLLEAIRWPQAGFSGVMDFKTLNTWQQKILDYLEENGHPFGKVYLDSIDLAGDRLSALLQINEGPIYKIDSIRVYGDVKLDNAFLQRFLQLPNGSVYNKKKLMGISKKLTELTFLQEEKPFDLSLLGTGSVLNLYLKQKRNSQVNALIGLLPNSNAVEGKKMLLTVDANILLRNALGSGETMGVIWQQLQQKSPRINLLFDQPFIFHSPLGLAFSFDMFRKDSSFVNINMNLGTTYRIGDRKTASIFLVRRQTIVNGINERQVIQTRTLPREADVSSLNLGAGYSFVNTDYRLNPRKGNEITLTASAGNKQLKRNSQVLELKDPSDPAFKFGQLYDTVKLRAYQFRVTTSAAQYLPLGGQSTVKLGLNAGIYQSANFFRNELFQIGGYRLMRGFDEESQYVSQYAVGTVEYRYLLARNSAFFVYGDGGWGKHEMEAVKNHTYLGTGLGLSFETKAGLFNMAWAVGKRNDTELNLRQSKVHLGFVSYF